MLKKFQRVSVRQFVEHVKQFNSYIAQLPCWFYSPSARPSTVLISIPFAKADLVLSILLARSLKSDSNASYTEDGKHT
jgi:hypothetical protein